MRDLAPDVLVIEHEADCPPGVLTDVLEEADLDLHLYRPHRGIQMPADLSSYEGLVVLGGAMAARDDARHPWMPHTRRLLSLAVERHVPTLGICLGAQLAALGLEGRMGRREQASTGLTSISLTEAGQADPVLSALGSPNPTVFHWHQDEIMRLPPYSTRLASGADDSIQAFRSGRTLWAVQFHPELTPRTAQHWAQTSSLADSDHPPRQVRAELEAATEARASWRAMLAAFAAQVHTG